ncbi:MAG: transketolase [Bacteroidales bacterium]|nr:transketolase [Bacteroidales bacterium]
MKENISERAADNIRALSVAMVEKAGSGHPGGSMGGADFIQVLYSEFLVFDPDEMTWPLRDRFFLDPGHLSPMLYANLAMFGIYSMGDLRQFRQWKSVTPGHPEFDVRRGVENTSGPLGQGHAMAVGAAIAERFLAARFGEWMSHKIYTYVSDGSVQEEISQGAGRIAGYLGLNNLVMFYDANDIQLSTPTRDVTSEDTAAKYEAWGWRVVTINGNDHMAIRQALQAAGDEKEKPFLIIGKTVMGRGCKTEGGGAFEAQVSTHGQPISKAGASAERTLHSLGADPGDPFRIFGDVAEYYRKVKSARAAEAQRRKQAHAAWELQNPEMAGLLSSILNGDVPEFDFSSVQLKESEATRATSGRILSLFSGKAPNMIVISADLSNSDKTEGFLKNEKPISTQDKSGAFLHAGVSELTMAALANGMALHYIIPVCGTFFVFSDYMKPAMRLAALMQLPVKYIWTHDSFRVGEDGPTHQPVEHEAQIRLMEQLKNHSGRSSMLVLRPADGAETVIAWQMALENVGTPTALILSRQTVHSLPPVSTAGRLEESRQMIRGGYVVSDTVYPPDIVLLANGSEVYTLLDAATRLRDREKMRVRVVSIPSIGLFEQQNPEYISHILPPGVPVYGLTAGLPSTLQALADHVYGLDHFGLSAPFQVLDEKFGFNPERIAQDIIRFIENPDKSHSLTEKRNARLRHVAE